MAAAEIHKGDIGTVFEVTVKDGSDVVDISVASTYDIIFKKPNDDVVAQTGVFVTDGTDGKMKYTTISGDLDISGGWQIQASLVMAAGVWKSDVGKFTVFTNLE